MIKFEFYVLGLLVIIKGCAAQVVVDSRRNGDTKDWWETGAFYQIYPRSFKDSNGDGIGDLGGIADPLTMNYVQDIGINAFWLSPIFQSPMADFGYDISDYYAIQPEYGTMADFEELLRTAKIFKLKVILDFVPNHSSDKNAMFEKSARREPGFEDFYIWHPGKPNPVQGERPLPPNNWISLFRFSAWTWNEVRGEYYYHAFLPQQPDLNYRNPKVVEEMKNVLRFWLAKGVDGFRIDAVPSLFEVQPDAQGNFPDEPKSGNSADPDDYGYLNHIYTQDQPETVDMVYQWRAVMDEFQRDHGGDTRIIMTETYSNIDIVMQYYGNETMNGAHIPFNFQLIMGIKNDSTASDFKRLTDLWLDKMPKGRTPNWVMGNHDNNRVASRYGTHKIDAINMILLTLPGVSVTYYGEEIGMSDVWISWADTVDPEACRTNPDVYMSVSRDPERTPFQWNNSTSAGFSKSSKTWLPVAPDFQTVNAEAQMKSENNTHLQVYLQLTALRESAELQMGTHQSYVVNDVFVIHRKWGESSVLTVANLGAIKETIDFTKIVKVKEVLLYWILDSTTQKRNKMDHVAANKVVVEPFESFVLLG